MKLYKETEKSTFSYWFAHWRAFNLTAMLLGVWKPKYLFHDIEKPFLMWWWKDYKRVRNFHRTHARHHWEYQGKRGYDYEAMVIDWECSRYTKESAPMTAYETYLWELDHNWEKHKTDLTMGIAPILHKLHLHKED